MSYEVGVRTVRLEPCGRLAHMEYCFNEALVRELTGRDPRIDEAAWIEFHDAWQLDMLWHVNDGPVPWSQRGRTTDMGHSEYVEGGTDKRPARPCPFRSVEALWAFDAAEEYGLPEMDELVDYYEDWHRCDQHRNANQLCPGGYYKTLFSGAIAAFGWSMLLEAAADRDRFDRVLEGFYRLSRHHFEAWSRTSIEAFICHDDMVWTSGPFMHPQFYRRVVFPRYRQLWNILRRRGKKVLYTCDGDYTMFLDGIAAAGADGFIFEPLVDLDAVVAKFGRTHVICGSKVDARTLTFGSRDDIRREVDDTLALAKGCPGFFFVVGNHIPANVPLENAQFYFEYLSSHWSR